VTWRAGNCKLINNDENFYSGKKEKKCDEFKKYKEMFRFVKLSMKGNYYSGSGK